MFLQFFVWGSWYVTAGTYLMQGLGFTGTQIGLVYGSSAVAAAISPFAIGLLTDRYFSTEKVLGILQFSGAIVLYILSYTRSFNLFYPLILVYMLIFIPSFSLTNAVCFQHLKDAKTEFPKIRVWGTIAWISSGVLVSYLKIEAVAVPMRIAALVSLLLAFYSFTLPSTKPPAAKVSSFKAMLTSPELRKLLDDNGFRILIFCIALICIPSAYYYSFLNPFLNEMGIRHAAGKMAVGQFTEIIIMLSLPFLFRYIKLKWLILTGLTFWGLRYLIIAYAVQDNIEWMYMLAIAMHGPSYVLALLTAQILLDIRVPSELRSTAQGFFSLITLGLGAFIGSFVAGKTISIYTISANEHLWGRIWLIPAVFAFIVALIFAIKYKGMSRQATRT